MDQSYHYPPDVLNLLVNTIPLLCRSKNDVLVFFRGAGVPDSVLVDPSRRVRTNKENINKYEIARMVIQRINEKGDSELRTRREVIKRVVEFEDFSTCWPNDQLKAKGFVCELRRVVNVKDSFTRMAREREREKRERMEAKEAEVAARKRKVDKIDRVKADLYALFSLEEQPQKRGKYLEGVINSLFSAYGILVKEDFKRVDPDGAGVIEQVDGVVEFSGHIYIVERIYGRPDVRGLFIASNGYSDTTIAQCREALGQKTIALISLQEIVILLER